MDDDQILEMFHNFIVEAWNQVKTDNAESERTYKRKIDSEQDVISIMYYVIRKKIERTPSLKDRFAVFTEAKFHDYSERLTNSKFLRNGQTDLEIFDYKHDKHYIEMEFKRANGKIFKKINVFRDVKKLEESIKYLGTKRAYLFVIGEKIENENKIFNKNDKNKYLTFGKWDSDKNEDWWIKSSNEFN